MLSWLRSVHSCAGEPDVGSFSVLLMESYQCQPGHLIHVVSDSGLASNWDQTFILILTMAATQVNCMVGLGGGKGEGHFSLRSEQL